MKLKTGKLRVGVIGLGVGEAHVAAYQAHPDCVIGAVCDFSDSRFSEARNKYRGLKVSRDANDILEDPGIDVVSIASYDDHHYEQVIKALQNGKHVFVEKPICLYEEEAIHIRSLLRANPALKVSSNLILRKSPRFRRLKRMIRHGEFGELFCIEGDYHYGRLKKITEGWRGKLDFYSVVYGGSVHLIDLLLWLTGDTVVEVMAYGNQIASKGTQFQYNDCVIALLKFRSGLIGKVGTDFGGVRPHFHNLSIYGTNATFVNDLPNGKLFLSRNPENVVHDITDAYPGVQKGDLISSFIDSIVNGTECEVSEEDIFKTMSVCFAIEESMRRNTPMVVRYL